MPMPTKYTAPFLSRRAAAIVIISFALKAGSGIGHPHRRHWVKPGRTAKLVEIGGGEHVLLHPRGKCFALARDIIPGFIEGVVALVVAVRIAGVGAARH